MSCNPTRILLSNAGSTTMLVTVEPTPDPEVQVTFQVDELGINESEETVDGVATFVLDAVTATNNSIWDATIQIGANMRAAASAQAVETNGATSIGVTVSSGEVTYCAPTGGGGGTGTVTGVSGTAPISSDGASINPTISLDDAGITAVKIADDAVETAKIDDGAVTNGKIADLTIQHGKIANATITSAKLDNSGVSAGAYTNADITVDAQGRITDASDGTSGGVTSIIAGSNVSVDQSTGDVTISSTAGGTGTVTEVTGSPQIGVGPNSTTTPALSLTALSVSSAFLAGSSVVTDKINNGAVTTAKIDDDAVTAAKLADTSVTADTYNAADITVDAQGRITAAYAGKDAYTGQVVAPANSDVYTIDPVVVSARTILNFYAKNGGGSCTATLKNNGVTVATIAVTTSSGFAGFMTNTAVSDGDPITIEISNNTSAANLVFQVEYSQ